MEVASLSPLPVGVLLWNGPEPSLTVLTKMTLRFGPLGFEIAETQEPLRGPRASRFGCPLELDHPGDFVPQKAACDVLLTGNAHADAPSLVIGANVRIGPIRKRFYALASARSVAIPLSCAYLREGPAADAAEVTVGPMSALHPERAPYARVRLAGAAALRREVLSTDFDFGYFNSAPSDQRLTAIAPGMEVRLHGLAPGGAVVHGQLPMRWPRIHVPDDVRGHGLREVGLVCDTMWIDTDRSRCELTFRGTLVLRKGALPSRIIATIGEAFGHVDPARIEARMSFAQPHRAAEAEDVEAPLEDDPQTAPLSRTGAAPKSDRGTALFVRPEPAPKSDRGTALFVRPEPAAAPKSDRGTALFVQPEPAPKSDRGTALFVQPEPAAKSDRRAPSFERPAADPEGTVLHKAPPARPKTLPFAGSAAPAAPETPRVPPPASGLPFLAPRGPATLELPPEVNPALAAMPFPAGGPRRIKTLDVLPGAQARAPLPFGEGPETGTLSGLPRSEVSRAALPFGEGPETGTLSGLPRPEVSRAALPFGEDPETGTLSGPPRWEVGPSLPFAAPAAPAASNAPAASPVFGLPPSAPPAGAESAADTLPPSSDAEPDRDTLRPPAGPDIADPITLVPPAQRAGGTSDTLPPVAGFQRRDTLPPTAGMPAIPFAPALPGGLETPRPAGAEASSLRGLEAPRSPGPEAAPPRPAGPAETPPWAAGLGPARRDVRADSLSGQGLSDGKLGLFSLEKDAEIQLALWREAGPLHETLAAHGTDELTWREHRRLRDAVLRAEADAGDNAKALAVHEAIEHARQKSSGHAGPSLDLPAYAEVRVVLKDADDELAALAARGIDPAVWERDHRHYRKRLLKDPAFAAQLRAEIEARSSPPRGAPEPGGKSNEQGPRPSPQDHEPAAREKSKQGTSKSRARVRKMTGSRKSGAGRSP